MKKLHLLLWALIALTACKAPEQKAIERVLSLGIEDYDVMSFRQNGTETLGRQYERCIHYCKSDVEMAESDVRFYKNITESIFHNDDDFAKLESSKKKLAEKEAKLKYFSECLQQQINDTSKIILTYYELVYRIPLTDKLSIPITCTATFNKDGQMTRIQPTEESSWEVLIPDIEIPKYYEYK